MAVQSALTAFPHGWCRRKSGHLHALRGLEHERAQRVRVQVEVVLASLADGVIEGHMPVRDTVPIESPAHRHRMMSAARWCLHGMQRVDDIESARGAA